MKLLSDMSIDRAIVTMADYIDDSAFNKRLTWVTVRDSVLGDFMSTLLPTHRLLAVKEALHDGTIK